jgi:diacylglycerol kinase (ATP)
VGGDGTVNEVAKGLIHSPVQMGIIPRGSGNGLARHLGIPMNVSGALKSLAESNVIEMDTFLVNEHLSLNVSGIGFDGHIAGLFSQTKKRGLLGYVKLTLMEFIQFRNLRITLVADGRTYTRDAFILAIANSSQYGNNARIAPTASVCDQILNITLVKKIPFYRMDFVYDLFARNSRYCETLQANEISISLQTPMAYHVDGEPTGVSDKFSIKLIPASLKVLTPATTV